jgi:hypothetical protein
MPIQLMLATLTDRRDFGDDWLLERKLDGERCVARRDGGDERLESRTGKDLTATYPEVRAAVAAQRPPTSCSTARWSRTTASRRPSAGSSSASGSPSPLESTWPRPGRLLRLRPPRGRRRESPRPAAPRALRPAGEDDPAEGGIAAHRSLARRLSAAVRRGLPVRLGRAHRQARRRTVCPGRSKDWLAKAELDEFVDKLRAEIKLKVSPVDVVGALVIAGRSLPPTVVRELVDMYNEEAAKHI